jgi:hypothetical protein
MNTGDETETPSSASAVSQTRGYVPGAPVRKTKRQRKSKERQHTELPTELLEKILLHMADSQNTLSIIKLSMVNRHFRDTVNKNLQLWYRLYLEWRGPVENNTREYRTPRGVVRLRPTVPISVPNFRIKAPPLT